jgi:TIR domain
MQIRQLHTNKVTGMVYSYWKECILDKHLEENYEILSPPDLVDVFIINTEDGKKEFLEITDRHIAIQQYLETSDKYFINDTTAKFDSNYRVTKRPKDAPLSKFQGVFELLDFELNSKTIKMNKFSKIFISHSSKDKEIVEELIELIELIGVSGKDIFCSSIHGYGIPLGDDFLERLKSELNDNAFVIFMLSQNFYDSPICLCEMGASWIKTNKHIPVLIPPFDYSKIKGVINNTQGFKIDQPLEINQLKKELENAFNLTPIDFSKWEARRDKIITSIKSKIQTISIKKDDQNLILPTPLIKLNSLPEKEEQKDNIYLSTYLHVSEFEGVTGINIGVTVTNTINGHRYFNGPYFILSKPLMGNADSFRMMETIEPISFPKKMEYGEQYQVMYVLKKGF